jgi:hypothetical protein
MAKSVASPSFKPAALVAMIQGLFADRALRAADGRAPRAVRAARRLALEPIEPRLLLDATIEYGNPLDAVYASPLPSDLSQVGTYLTSVLDSAAANLTTLDFTLRAVSDGGNEFWRLFNSSSNAFISQAPINNASDLTLNLLRYDPGLASQTGLDLKAFIPDTLRIDLASLEVLEADYLGQSIQINFDGGSQVLSLLGIDDDVILQGTADLGLGLTVKSNSDILLSNVTLAAPAITIDSAAANGGLYDKVDEILAGADSSILLDNSHLTSTGATTLKAKSTITANSNGFDLGSVSVVGIASFSTSRVELKNGSTLSAGGALALTAEVAADIDALTGTQNVKIAGVLGAATPEVIVTGGALSAGAGATLSATANLDILASTKPNASSNSTTSDAAVAIVGFDSSPKVELRGGAALTVTSGSTSLAASNNVTVQAIADGRIGGSAGGTLGVSTLLGDTLARVDGASITSAGSVTVAATSVRNLSTTAHATPDGAKDGGGSNESEKRLQDPNQDGNSNDKAQTGDGQDVGFAAAVAVTILTGDSLASVNNARITTTGGGAGITIAASADNDTSTTGNGSATSSSGAGVGVGVAIAVADVGAEAWIQGTSDLDANNTVNVTATLPQSNFVASAKSGASGGGSGLGAAGALVVNVTLADAKAGIAAGAVVDLNGSNLVVSATSTTDSDGKAEAGAAGGGSSLGLGASVVINYAENETLALLGNGATINSSQNGSGGTVGAVTLAATSNHGMKTEAIGGASGGTAITPVAALSFATYDTTAQFGTGTLTTTTGAVAATATHTDDVQTTATGKTTGDTAVGASFALAVHGAAAVADAQRNLNAGGNLGLTANNRSNTKTGATASAKGSEGNGGNVDSQADGQRDAGNQAGTARGGKDTAGTGDTPSASSSDGNVAVAAAVAINVVNTDASTGIAASRSITSGGTVALLSTMNSDVEADASGEATTDGAVGVGAAVALNFVEADNRATVGNSSSIHAQGLSVTARMNDVAGESPDEHLTKATAVSGAGGKDVGVAGSVVVNLVDIDTTARIGNGVGLTLTGGAVGTQAVAATRTVGEASPKDGGASGSVGVGASVTFQKVDTTTLAEVGSGGSVSGSASGLNVLATGTHAVSASATHGAAGDDAAIGGSVAINLVGHTTAARVQSGAAFGNLTGAVAVQATHTSTTTAATKADVASDSVGVGAGIGINVATDTVDALLARSVSTSGAVTVLAAATVNSVSTGTAAASGGKKESDGGKDADSEADEKVNSNANKGAQSQTVPKAQDSSTAGSNKANSEGGSGSGGSSGVGVAAAIGVNASTVTVQSATASGADITAGGAVTIGADASVDAKAQTDGTAVDLSSDKVAVGAAVSLNVIKLTQEAKVGTGSVVSGSSVNLRAETLGSNRNDYSATAYAAGGTKGGSAAVGASLALNVVTQAVRAFSDDGSSLVATAGGVTVSAEHDMGLLSVAMAAGLNTSGSTAVGGAVAMNLVNIGDNAAQPYDTGTFAAIGNGAAGGAAASASATGAVSVRAESSITTLQLDLPDKINDYDQDGTEDIPDPDIQLSSAAIGAAASGGSGAGVGASVVVNWIESRTEALVDNGALVNAGALVMRADDDITIASVAGSIGIGASGSGVGAGVDLLVLERTTAARVGTGAQVTLGSGASSVVAESDETLLSVSANAGVGGSVAGIAGSASVHVINRASGNGTHAQVAGQVTGTGDFAITASADFTDKMIAGSVGVGSNAGIGVANTTLVHTHAATAGIADGGGVSLSGAGADASISASTTESLLGVVATASAAGTAAVGGSVAVGVINQTTDAYVGRGATVNATGGSVSVLADADTVMTAVAGNVSFSGTASVGVGVDVGVVTKTTTARMESNVAADVGGNLRVVATASEDITSVVAGLAASGTAAVSVNPSIHTLNLTTLAHIGDDATVGPASSGAGNVNVNGSIEISADNATEIDKVSAGLAASGAAGIGLAANVSVINKRVEAFVGAGAEVNARGNGTAVNSALGVITAAKAASTASTQHASTADSAVVNGSAQSVGNSANVGVGSVDGGDTADEAQGSVQLDRTTQLGSFAVQGIAISATNRDDIASYAVAVGIGGGAGVGVGGAVTVFNTNTRAYVDNNASVNAPNNAPNAAQSVRIGAGNDFEQVGIVVGAAGGTVGVGVAAGITVLNATTEAFIDDGATVRAANDVTVDARSSQDAILVDASLGAGFVGVGGSVGVLTLNDTVKARIGNAAVVSAGDTVAVRAHSQTDTTTVDGGVAGGFVGVGVAVGVLVVDKSTTAEIDDFAQVDALGNGSGVGDVLNGNFVGGDAAQGFARTTATGLVVQATSQENVLHIVVAGGGGLVGVGGAVGVVVIDSDTVAEIGQAQVNQNNLGGEGQDVYVLAGNDTRLRAIRGGVGGGFVGVGAAVDVGVVRNDVGAFIRNGASVRAGDEVEVDALAIKKLDGFTAAAGVGAVGVSGSVSVWSVGTDTTSGYDADGNNVITADERPAEDGGLTAENDAGAQAQKSLQGSRDGFAGYGSGGNANDPSNRSRSEAQAAAGAANTRLGGGDMPSEANIAGRYNAPAQLAGTQAIIETGSTVQAGASVAATGGITVHAKADVEINMFNGQLAIGVVGAGGAVGILSIQEKVEAVAGGTLSADGPIDIYAHLDSEMHFLSLAGNGGAVALGASVMVLNDSSVVLARIAQGAVIDNAGAITVKAESDRVVTAETKGVTVGAVAAGASVGVVNIGGQVSATVGSDARIGQDVNFDGTVASLSVQADANERAEVDTVAILAGIGGGTANVGTARVTTAVTAELGANALATTSGLAAVDAVSVMDADVAVFGAAVGGGAVAVSAGTVSVAPTVTAAARSGSKLQSTAGQARVRASHNEGVVDVAKVETTAGSGGIVVGGAGAVSDVEHNAVVLATAEGGVRVLAGTTAELAAFSGAKAHADSGSLGVGALAMGTSVGLARVGGSVTADFQGAQMTGATVRVATGSDLAARGETVATTGGVIGASINQATATVSTAVTSRVGSGQLAASGNVEVAADADARAHADSGGIETDEDADWPNLSLLGGVGLSASDATLNSTVRAQVGAATVNAGGQFIVQATHNEGNSQKAYAVSSASGGSLGVTVSGADSDATSSADAIAEAGGNGASFTAQGGVVVRALASNQAEAIVDAFGLGGIGGIGASDATAKTDGGAEARITDGAGLGTSQRTQVRGAGLTVDADTLDRARAISNGAGGGLFVGGSFNQAEAVMSPRTIAEVGAFADVDVGGTVRVTADAATEGDASTEGSQGGAIAIGDSVARVRVGDLPNSGDRITVRAAIGDSALIDAGALEVRARHNDTAALDQLRAVLGGTTNGNSRAFANSSGGGAAGISNADAATVVRTDVDAQVGANADITVAGSALIGAVSNAIAHAEGRSAQGGLGAFGTGDGQVFVRQNADASVGAGARIVAGGEIRVTAVDDTVFDTFAESSGGGAISVATATAGTDIDSSSTVSVGANADLFAKTNVVARASQAFGGEQYARARSYGAGAGANGYMNFSLSPASLALPSVAVNVGTGAKLYAQEALVLDAVVDGRTVESRGDSDVVAVIADTDSEANTNINAFARVNVATGAFLTGEDRLEVNARVERFVLDNGSEERGGIEADGVGGSDSDADSYFNPSYRSHVLAADGATFASRDLQVRTTTVVPGWGFYLYAFGLIPDVSADGSMTLDRQISWDADVVLLSAPNPELTVEADGTVSRADNVTVNGGLGVGANVGLGGSFTVDPILNNHPGRALFEANAVSNPFSDDDIWDDYDFSQTSMVFGNDGTWYARRTFDRVELVNRSSNTMVVGDIRPIDRDGDPDGEVFINVNDRNGGAGKDPFNFRIVNQFEPTLITITSTNAAPVADIEFAGEVDNPIGHTEVTGASDIISDGSQLIRTNTITLNAALNIGNLAPFAFQDQTKLVGEASSRTPLRIDLVQSFNRPEDLDATAGRDIVLDVRGLKRQEGGGGFTVDVSNVDAGRNADVFMLNAREETTPAGVGSYALIIDENFNGGIDEIPFVGNTPDPLPYIQFFKPDDAGIVFDFWKNLTAPLGVFGTFTANIEATYDFGLVQAGRVTNGGDIQLNGELAGVDVNIRANTNIFGTTTGLLFALTDGDIDFTETLGDMRLGRVKSSEGDVELTSPADIIDVESLDHLSTASDTDAEADVTGRSITLNALSGFIGEKWQGLAGLFTTTPVDFIEIDSSFSGTGTVTATALKEIYLDELSGAMNLNLVRSLDTDVVLHTRAGGITDGNGAANNIRARSIDLVTVGGGVGTAGDDVEIDTDAATLGGTTGRLYANATANGAADAGIYITEINASLDVLRARTDKGDVRLTLVDTATVPAATLGEDPSGTPGAYADSFVRDVGENLIVLANGVTLENQARGDGRVEAERDVLLRVGDNVEMLGATTSFILAGRNIDIYGDWGNADAGGTIMNLRGEVTSDFSSPANAKQVGERTRLFGHTEADRFSFLQLKLGGDTYAYGSQNATAVLADDGQDRFLVDRLQDLTSTRGFYVDSLGNVLPRRDALTLDGQADTDAYIVVTHGSLGGNNGLGGISDYIVNTLDTGAPNDGVDTLTVDGSSDADIFLLRGQNYIPGHAADRPAFVALLHGDLAGRRAGAGRQPGRPGREPRLALPEGRAHQLRPGHERPAHRLRLRRRRLLCQRRQQRHHHAGRRRRPRPLPDRPALPLRARVRQRAGRQRLRRRHGADDARLPEPRHQRADDDLRRLRQRRLQRLQQQGRAAPGRQRGQRRLHHPRLCAGNRRRRRRPDVDPGRRGRRQHPVQHQRAGQHRRRPGLRPRGGAGHRVQRQLRHHRGRHLRRGAEGHAGRQRGASRDRRPGRRRQLLGAGHAVRRGHAHHRRPGQRRRQRDGRRDRRHRQPRPGRRQLRHRACRQRAARPVLQQHDRPRRGPEHRHRRVRPDRGARARWPHRGERVGAAGQHHRQLRGVPVLGARRGGACHRLGGALAAAGAGRHARGRHLPRLHRRRELAARHRADLPGGAGRRGLQADGVREGGGRPRAEGRRTAVISHSSLSADPAFNWVAVRNVEVDIIDDDKAGIYVEQSFSEFDNGTQVLEGDAVTRINDTYTVRLASAPTGATSVQLAWDTAEITLSTADARWNAATQTIGYTAANWFVPVTFTIQALQDGVRENREIVPITHTVTASTDLRYVNPFTPGPDVAVEKLKVSVIDGDSEGVLVTQSFGSTLVVQDNPDTPANEASSDTYTVRLTKAPVGTVTVTTLPMSLPDADGGLVQTVFTLPTALEFTRPTGGCRSW